jgi:hypothetical protein
MCRCPVTRRESLSLLQRNPPREAVWDAEQVSMVVQRTIELEEREVDPVSGWPVQRVRLGPAIITDMNETGGFSVGFRSIAWMLGIMRSPCVLDGGDPTGPGVPTGPGAEWVEWLQT